HRGLLIRELRGTHGDLQLIQRDLGFSLRVKQIADLAPVATIWTKTDNRVLFRDRRKVQMSPTSLLEEMTDEVIGMEPLHDDDDRALGLMVEPRQQRVRVPLL